MINAQKNNDMNKASLAILKAIGMAVAVADGNSGKIEFENAHFFEWFPPLPEKNTENDDLFLRLGETGQKLKEKIEKSGKAKFEIELKIGAKTITASGVISRQDLSGENKLVLEAQNISKQKQVEYMLDSYSKMAEKHTRDLQKEKDRVEKLLLNIMPRSVYDELKDYGTTTPQKFDCVSVLVLDFVGFTRMAVSQDPGATISELNDIFSAFDRIVELFGCERIKTIGDSYICVSGMPEENPDHAQNIAKVAVRMRRYIEKRNASHPQTWECRIGIASGELIGSMVGIHKYVYDIFGPAVNLASRLENIADPGCIVIDSRTQSFISESFSCGEFGVHQLKGFGKEKLYLLNYETSN